MKINPVLIIIVAIVVVAGALSGVLIYPAFLSIKGGSGEILAKKGEMAALDMQSKELDAFKKNYIEYAPNFVRIDNTFVDAANPIEFIKFLETTAVEAGVGVEINVSSLPRLQASVKGYFLDVLQFLEKIENGPYLLNVQKLVIAQDSDAAEGKNIQKSVIANFTLEVVTRSQKP